MSRCRHWCMVLSGCLALLVSQNAFAFRCGGGLVSVGDNKLSVMDKCGEPDWTDRWTEEVIDFPDTDQEHRSTRLNERWIYNPGPNEFIRIVIFSGSTVSALKTGGRGFTLLPGTQRCDLDVFSIGTTSSEIATLCGEPDLKDQRYEMVTQKIPGGRRQILITVDEWTFNPGPSSFMRILTFHNGDLVSIRTGERGFR